MLKDALPHACCQRRSVNQAVTATGIYSAVITTSCYRFLSAMTQRIYTIKDVLSMLDTDSVDDFEGYVDEEEYAERHEYSDIENNDNNSENECEMEEDISEIASVDEMEVENEILVENEHLYDSEDCHSGSASATASPSASATPGTSFTATPGPTQEMSNKNPLDFFRLLIFDSILDEIVKQTNLYAECSSLWKMTFHQDQGHICGIIRNMTSRR